MNQQDFFESGKENYSGSAQCDRLWWVERHRKHDLLQLFFDQKNGQALTISVVRLSLQYCQRYHLSP
ncbi:hypothetical protein [Nostoc sp.]|uniref:hypothetical protein n=1 Tax=Nostoc sp. TaxID=1180 RepID=UPI002FF5E7F5